MDEKYRQYKKTWAYKMHLLMNFMLVILFGVIVYCAYLFYQSYHGEEPLEDNENYSYSINENVVILLNEGFKQTEYRCQNNCTIYDNYFSNGQILLKDGNIYYLYDLVNNKKISDNYDALDLILDNEGNVKLFKVTSNNKSGIMNLNGTVQVNLIYDELGTLNDENKLINYLYDKNYITAKSGDKWGMISLDNGKGLIDFQYEEIHLVNNNKLAVKEGEIWFLVDDTNKKALPNGYNGMVVYNDLIVVAENSEVFIINFNGEVMSNKLPIYFAVNHWLDNNQINGLYTILDNNQIMIYIGVLSDDNNQYEFIKYAYSKDTKQIIGT